MNIIYKKRCPRRMAKTFAVARYAALMTIVILMVGASLSTVAPVAKIAATAETQPRAVVYDTSTLKPDQVMTPWGPQPATNVHEFNGTTINIDAELAKDPVKRIDLRPTHHAGNPPTDGYQEDAYWSTSNQITVFDGYWKVPAAPTYTYSGNQVLYLFIGLEPSDASYILQPVLQYGAPPGDSLCNCWEIQSWLVLSNNQYWHGPVVTVNVGDTIVGNMAYQSSTTFLVQTTDITTNGQSSYTASSSKAQQYANVALETYYIPTNTCTDLPGNEEFYSMQMNLGALTPSWSGEHIAQGWCNIQNPTINSPSDVLIHTQS